MKRSIYYLLLLVTGMYGTACNKTVVNFGKENLTDDPNIIYLDSFVLKLATYQLDSFATASDSLFKAGLCSDSLLGIYSAQSWFPVGRPATNPLSGCVNCSFDSLVFRMRFSGSSYGDTTVPFRLNLHRLTQPIATTSNWTGYNTSAFTYDPAPLAGITLTDLRPSAKQPVAIRMPDELGLEFFNMLKRNADTMTNQDKFIKYFYGLVLKGDDAGNKAVYYFTPDDTMKRTVRLYYRVNSTTPQQQYLDFTLQPATSQFYSFNYDKSGTPLAAFLPKKKQTLGSALTGNKVFLHASSGLFPRISLPDVFSLKELYPYIKVVKASLEFTPTAASYGQNAVYTLPPALGVYTINSNNEVGGGLTNSSGTLQTGNLFIDYLYHKDTRYTYDLTAYINSLLNQGRGAQQDLLLLPLSSAYENRLILNAAGQELSVKLKLYVLGL